MNRFDLNAGRDRDGRAGYVRCPPDYARDPAMEAKAPANPFRIRNGMEGEARRRLAVLLLAVALICGICVGGAALAAAWLGKPDAVATTAIDQDGISRSLSRGEPRAVQP